MLRVVFDTVVFVRALLNPKSRSGRLLFEHADQYEMIISQATAHEFLEVIQRPELTTKYPRLSQIDIRRVIELLAQSAIVQPDNIPSVVRDPKDDIFVATAIAGRAAYLVSEDKDLLVLGQVESVKIVDTHTFVKLFEPEA